MVSNTLPVSRKKYALFTQVASGGCAVNSLRFARITGTTQVIPTVYDVRAATEINALVSRAIQVIAAALPADHVLIQSLGTTDASSCVYSCIGWDRVTAARLANTFSDLLQQSGSPGLQDITPDARQIQGSIYIPAAAILEEYSLESGIFVVVPCRDGSLAMLAGSSKPDSVLAGTDPVIHCAMMNMLSLAVEGVYTEQENSPDMQQVLQAKHQWETTLDALPQLVCLIDAEGHVIRCNRTLEAWGLGSVTAVSGKQVHDVIHPGCSDWHCSLKARFESMWQELANTGFVECEYHNSLLGKELRCSINRCNKSQYEDGSEEAGYAFLVIEDISIQKRAERIMQDYNEELEQRLHERTIELTKANAALRGEIQEHLRDGAALRESEKKYTCLVETTLTGLYVLQDEHIVFCNKRFAEIFGYTQEEICALNMEVLFPAAEPDAGAGMRNMMNTEWMSEERIIKGATRDGKTLWLQRNLTRVDCANKSMIMGNILDITEQKITEDALRLSQRELQVLSGKLLEAQEAERKRVAMELHDSIGQSVSAIKFGMENAMREYESTLPGEARQYLRCIIDRLRDTIDEVRNISMNLRPSMLDDLGLKATIKWYTRDFISTYQTISVDTRVEITERALSDMQNIVIFRVIQESLNNIGKHAEASQVSIELLETGGMITLTVEDDGKGFVPETVCVGKGFGISSMRDRVKLTGGEFSVESNPGAGTVVRAAWPGIARLTGQKSGPATVR